MGHLAGFQSLRATMERCSQIVCDSYSLKPEQLHQFQGELPPSHKKGHRRHMYWYTEVGGDLVVALPGTTHPLDWSSNMCVHYTPVDGSHLPADTPAEQLEQVPCAHAGFYFRAETIPTLALLEQAAAKGLRLVLTGHSLGAAVANICTLTALQAQKKAREAVANAAADKRAAATNVTASSNRKQKKQSPWERAASVAAIAEAEGHTNHSWCSASSDITVSPQAALVDIVCLAFASPHWANQALADFIEDNNWGDVFVNVVVPEDYCLNLFNNVLTSANPAQRHNLSRSSSRISMHESSSATQLALDADDNGCYSVAAAAGDGGVKALHTAPFAPDPQLSASTADKKALLYGMQSSISVEDFDSHTDLRAAPASSSCQPNLQQQPLVSALAGSRRKHRKLHLTFSLPEGHGQQQPAGGPAVDAGSSAVPAGLSITAGADAMASNQAECPAHSSQVDPYAAQGRIWSEMRDALPPSPSCASLSSLSSLNSTRSWTLMAYLPDVLLKTFSTGSSGSLDGLDSSSNSGSSRSSSGSSRQWSSTAGCPDAVADAVAAAFIGVEQAASPHTAVVAAAAAAEVACGSYAFEGRQGSLSNGFQAWGLRHAKSSGDLPSLSSEGAAADSSVDGAPAAAAAAGTAALQVCLTAGPEAPSCTSTPQLPSAKQSRGSKQHLLRRSATFVSLEALSGSPCLKPPASLQLTSSLSGSVRKLLPSLRSVALASRAVIKAAESIKDAAFFVPVNLFEAYLIRALRPPLYQPVGQHWILSATGLVPQQQPITMYPRHIHDVYWHKELATVAFREHSIVFYKTRLLQQANRR